MRVRGNVISLKIAIKTNLNTVAPVDLHVAGIVLPDNTELHDTLGNLRDSESLLVLRVPLEERSEGGRDLVEGLQSANESVKDKKEVRTGQQHTCSNSGSEGRTIFK